MSTRNLKDGSKNPWICECYPNGRNGKRVRKRFSTKGEAVAYERYIMREVDDKPWLGEKPDHRRLADLIELWFQLHGKKLSSGHRAQTRMLAVCNDLNNPIASHITTKELAHYFSDRPNRGQGRTDKALANNTIVNDIANLRGMFNQLTKLDEWEFPNPFNGLNSVRRSEPELTFLTEAQILHLFETIKQSDCYEELRKIFKICLATGARINESVLLKGSHVFDCKITFVNTKGKRNRTIPISEALYQEIKPTHSGRLFTCGYQTAYKWLNRALPELPYGQATHVLRHTFATEFMRGGGNILDLQHALGHKNIKHTMIYAHFSPDHLSSVVRLNPLNRVAI
ncbi:tyrosine-type recombinase/integrase [Photobacterium sp. 1_MG-2023]|uniref:phage integrase n=1 Tax=Photobacterium sp. 1_MG-2023 TaxID=3062646 RepID=UPI0026E179DD|nr:tyrosine-type recombinase/integrase [Photobacterium sp. 1_MG-2023]MDO6706174.1 tyrosine-type recombinase/integrase [Photobacterium sp. 1_MG-2023]